MRPSQYAQKPAAPSQQPQFIIDRATGEMLRPADAVPGILMNEGCEESININDIRHAGDRAYIRHLAANSGDLDLV